MHIRRWVIRIGSALAAFALLGTLLTANARAADLLGPACKDEAGNVVAGTGGAAGCENQSDARITGSNGIIHNITNILFFAGGIAAVVMIIVGGFMYITSGGDSGKLTSAKNTILYSVIGLVVIIMARTIILFVINRV